MTIQRGYGGKWDGKGGKDSVDDDVSWERGPTSLVLSRPNEVYIVFLCW